MTTRKELIEALRARYSGAPPMEKTKILDEFAALTGYHRKHAIRVLREEAITKETRARIRLYDEAVRQAVTVLWEAADRVCGKRLKAVIPMLVDSMERHGHLDLDPVVKTKVLQVSAATIDRVLADVRKHIDGQRKRRKGVGAAIRRSIPVRTFADWRDPPPGFFEIDMVEHYCGPKTDGDYVHTLTLTDIASGWTECVAMRVRCCRPHNLTAVKSRNFVRRVRWSAALGHRVKQCGSGDAHREMDRVKGTKSNAAGGGPAALG